MSIQSGAPFCMPITDDDRVNKILVTYVHDYCEFNVSDKNDGIRIQRQNFTHALGTRGPYALWISEGSPPSDRQRKSLSRSRIGRHSGLVWIYDDSLLHASFENLADDIISRATGFTGFFVQTGNDAVFDPNRKRHISVIAFEIFRRNFRFYIEASFSNEFPALWCPASVWPRVRHAIFCRPSYSL